MKQTAPFRGSAPFLEKFPRLDLPLRHFAAAAVAYLLFGLALTLGAHRLVGFGFDGRWALGLVHVMTLGWVSMTILGALLQMIPVHGGTSLRGPRAAAALWCLYTAGVFGFVAALWQGQVAYWFPALGIGLALIGYLGVYGATLRRVERLGWPTVHFINGLAYVAVVLILGVMLAVDRQRGILFRDSTGALIAHVHLALVGWATMIIYGASYQMIPALSLSRMRAPWMSRACLALTNAGLIGLALNALFGGRRWLPGWAALLAAGYALYVYQGKSALKPSLRPTPALTALALWSGAAWAALGVGLAAGWVPDESGSRAAYVFLALVGWMTPHILAQIRRIAPFLVWLHVYSPRDWLPPISVPRSDELVPQLLGRVHAPALAAAVALGSLGLYWESEALVRTAGFAVLASAATHALDTAILFRHVAKPGWALFRQTPMEEPDEHRDHC